MKKFLLFLAFTLFSVSSYAQFARPVNSFSSNQDNSDYSVKLASESFLPQDEFLLNMAKKYREMFTTCTYDGVPVNLAKSTHSTSLNLIEGEGKYQLSFSILVFDTKGNPVSTIGEVYYDGVVVEDTNIYSTAKTYLFNDGKVIVSIETLGEYFLKIDFGDKPLYGTFSIIKFKMDR